MENNKLVFGKKNYIIIAIGLAVLVLGFVVMSLESAAHGFGFMALTLAPVLILLGFIIQFFAIFYQDKNHKNRKA